MEQHRRSFVEELRWNSRVLLQDRQYRSWFLFAHALTVFATLEMGVSAWAGSVVLMADAAHLLHQSVALYIVLFNMVLSRKSEGPHFTFGFERFEVLFQFSNFCILAFVWMYMAKEVFVRMLVPPDVQITPVFIMGLGSCAVSFVGTNIRMQQKRLSSSLSAVSDGFGTRSSSYSSWVRSLLIDLSTGASSVAASIICFLRQEATADSLLPVIVLLLVLKAHLPQVQENMRILLQTVPHEFVGTIEKCLREISSVEGVLQCRNEHFWTLSGHKNIATLSVRVTEQTDEQMVLRQIQAILQPYVSDITVQVEKEDWSALLSSPTQNSPIPVFQHHMHGGSCCAHGAHSQHGHGAVSSLSLPEDMSETMSCSVGDDHHHHHHHNHHHPGDEERRGTSLPPAVDLELGNPSTVFVDEHALRNGSLSGGQKHSMTGRRRELSESVAPPTGPE